MRHFNAKGAAATARLLTKEEFDQVAQIAYETAGISLHDGKRTLVASRIAKLLRESDETPAAYINRAQQDPVVRQLLVQALTTNHTKFFREPHHFTQFDSIVRPALVQGISRGTPVRLWSAGCSSGEEVYSLAMTLLGTDAGVGRRLAMGDVRFLATDINRLVLTRGAAGVYPRDALNEIPMALAKPWTTPVDGGVQMQETLRQLVRFRELNLIGPWPMRGQFDAIFCRNTMIYFDAQTTEQLQCRLAENLAPGGYLYIGHSERLLGRATQLLEAAGQTMFRKVAG